ncbi:uncharacterized protein A1O9_08542, partial [Exophiala aquamarina CBS 119918]
IRFNAHLSFIAIRATLGLCVTVARPASALEVETSSCVLSGFVNSSAPNVRQFLGVPFAQLPEGVRRWLPPVRLQSSASVNAANFGPACPQVWINNETSVDVYSPRGGNETEYSPLAIFGEDSTGRKDLPVIVWYFGGGFLRGGTNLPYDNPQSWIERTQEHIVVAVNFRSNIFGFPNADGLDEQNLGLLDQRMGLEWVRDNIANFGGDPTKIIAWGQSAGAIAIDFLTLHILRIPSSVV